MMGHYDEQYAARELAYLNEKRKRQKARLDKLHDINATVGFGEGDGDNTLVEKEIVKHLNMAYELLEMVIRADIIQLQAKEVFTIEEKKKKR